MIRVRELAAVACSSLLLLKSGQATSAAAAASTTTTTTGPSNGGHANNGGSLSGRLNKLGTDGRSSAWASRKSATSTATATAPPPTSPSSALLLSLLRGGFDVKPELGRYSWIPAGEGDGGSLVRLSDSGEVVAGEVPGGGGGGEDGSGRVVMASVTAAAAAVLARVGVGRGGNPEAAAAAKDKAAKDATAAAAAAPRAGVAAAAATRSVAPAKSGGKKADAKRAVREKKEAAARALKGKKAAAAEQALREKAAAAEKAAREKKGASSKAVAAVAQPAAAAVQSVAGVGVSARWPMFSAFLYFLAMAFTIPVLPKVVNEMVTGSKAVTAASATLYGLLSSTDASFTLMTVKFHASMSDKYGRRPFLALSALGLGLGFFITYHSKRVWMLLLASAIDGCTSCMYSMAQACITDCVGTGPGLGEAFGVFQGLSLGMAFMIGLPLGGVLGAKRGVRFPLLVSVCLCAVNLFMIAFVMPETLPQEKRVKQVQMKQANPLGAVTMATRNNLITGVIACWTLLWIAHVGLQINWINYTDRKFGWGVAQSGASLALMGLLVAVFPKLIIPRLGLERSITTGLLIYTVGQLVIASAPGVTNDLSRYGTPMAVSGLVLASAGTIVFPSMLAYLCNQVGGGEVGALQGTTDTAKTICSVVFGPAMAWIFGYFISDNAYPRKIEGASYYVGAAVAALAYLTAQRTFSVHGSLDRVPPSARTKR